MVYCCTQCHAFNVSSAGACHGCGKWRYETTCTDDRHATDRAALYLQRSNRYLQMSIDEEAKAAKVRQTKQEVKS